MKVTKTKHALKHTKQMVGKDNEEASEEMADESTVATETGEDETPDDELHDGYAVKQGVYLLLSKGHPFNLKGGDMFFWKKHFL